MQSPNLMHAKKLIYLVLTFDLFASSCMRTRNNYRGVRCKVNGSQKPIPKLFREHLRAQRACNRLLRARDGETVKPRNRTLPRDSFSLLTKSLSIASRRQVSTILLKYRAIWHHNIRVRALLLQFERTDLDASHPEWHRPRNATRAI